MDEAKSQQDVNAPIQNMTQAVPVEKKPRKVMPVILAIMVVLSLGMAGYIIYDTIANHMKNSAATEDDDKGTVSSNISGNITGAEEIDVNSDFVQDIIGPFMYEQDSYLLRGLGNDDFSTFYITVGAKSGYMDSKLMADFAVGQVGEGDCKKSDGYEVEFPGYDEQYWYVSTRCIDGDEINKVTRKMFGVPVTADFYEGVYYGFYKFSQTNNEFYYAASDIGGVRPSHSHYLMKAFLTFDKLYVFEIPFLIDYESNVCSFTDTVDRVYGSIEYRCVDEIIYSDYEDDVSGEDAARELVKQHPEEYMQFMWTFERDDNGNYIFAGLEEVKG